MHFTSRSFAILVLVATTRAASAQVIETPVAFDSDGKIRALTQNLVIRLGLSAPAWPVRDDFIEARLFESSTGGHVLVVERNNGSIERFPLTAEHTIALRFAVDAGTRVSGSAVSEEPVEAAAQPARGAFVRNQMLLTWGVYGPLLAAVADDAKAGTALVLMATGASYFAATALSRRVVITAAQNHLATDGALRGMGVGMGVLFAAAGATSGRAYAAAGLAGAVAGQVTGFQRGKKLTIAEAEAATAMSTYAAATALGLSGASGLINDDDDGRGALAAVVGAGLVGYALGPQYPRRARHTVTRGDIQILGTGAILGTAAGITPFLSDAIIDERPFFASATAGMLGGLFLVEQTWVRRYDHAARDAAETSLGMGAGALMGAGIGVLTDANAQAMVGLMTGGGMFGALIAHNLANPRIAEVRVGQTAPRSTQPRLSVTWNPAEMALSTARVPGRYSILTVKF